MKRYTFTFVFVILTFLSSFAVKRILYSQNFEDVTTASETGWSFGGGSMTIESDDYGKFLELSLGQNNGRSGYVEWGTDIYKGQNGESLLEDGTYTARFDFSIKKNSNNRYNSEITLFTTAKGTDNQPFRGRWSGDVGPWDNFLFDATQTNKSADENMTVAINAPYKETTAEDGTVSYDIDKSEEYTLQTGMWYTVECNVYVNARTVDYSVTELGGNIILKSGTMNIPETSLDENLTPVSMFAQGLWIMIARYSTTIDIDNIEIFYESRDDYEDSFSDNINSIVLMPGSIVPTWTQRDDNSWNINETGDGIISRSGGEMHFSFSSEKPVLIKTRTTDIAFHECTETNSRTDLMVTETNPSIILKPGEHDMFFDKYMGSACVYELGIFELDENINALSQDSFSFENTNDTENLWGVFTDENGAKSLATSWQYVNTSTLTLTTNFDKTDNLSCKTKFYGDDNVYLNCTIDNENTNVTEYSTSNGIVYSITIPEGTHTVKLEFTPSNQGRANYLLLSNFNIGDLDRVPDPIIYLGSDGIHIDGEGTIRYTLDGSDPTESYGTIYTEPFLPNNYCTIKAVAFIDEKIPSNIVTYEYTEPILSSDEINDLILMPGSIRPEWIQPLNNPWTINNTGDGIQTSSHDSELHFKFHSDKPVLIKTRSTDIGLLGYSEENNHIELPITVSSPGLILNPGDHELFFTVYTGSSELYELGIFELDTNLTSIFPDGSLPFEIMGAGINPWGVYTDSDNKKYLVTSWANGNTSSLAVKFTIDKPYLLKWDSNYYGDGGENYMNVIVNNIPLSRNLYTEHDWKKYAEIIPPGTYTVNLMYTNNEQRQNYLAIRDLMLFNQWMPVNTTPGSLTENISSVMRYFGYQDVSEVETLDITGTLNETDLDDMRTLNNLIALDLSKTGVKDIPENLFNGKTSLQYVCLPDTMNSIGSGAFCDSKIRFINIPEGISAIEESTFQNTNLMEVTLPESLRTIERRAFAACKYLNKVDFDENLQEIGEQAFYQCSLTSAILPLKLNRILSEAFSYNSLLTSITLHSGATNLPEFLTECPLLKTIIIPCATPPTIENLENGIGNFNKSSISILVPDFAIEDYQKDEFWSQFASISSTDEISNKDYWRIVGPLELNNGKTFQGKPDVDIYFDGGNVTIDENSSANLNKLILNNEMHYFSDVAFHYYNQGTILNNSNNVSAESISIPISLEKDGWYFFTPMFDVNIKDIEFEGIKRYVFRYYDSEARSIYGTSDNSTGNVWKNVTDGELKAGQGYIFQCGEKGIMTLNGNASSAASALNPNARNISLSDFPAMKSVDANWNFVGNPYPTYFDISSLDSSSPITIRECCYDENYANYQAMSPIDDDYVLRPMEAFFIQKPLNNTPAMIFNPEGRQVTPEIDNPTRSKSKKAFAAVSERDVFNIEITDMNGYSFDRARVVINEKASLDYEMTCDASKFLNESKLLPQIYTVDAEGNRLAINERPLSDGFADLVVITGNESQYLISATRADGQVILVDTYTGKATNLNETDCELDAKPNSVIQNRYKLLFNSQINDVENIAVSGISITPGVGHIDISNPNNERVIIYSADGKIRHLTSDANLNLDIEAGVYVIRTNEKATKIIVR